MSFLILKELKSIIYNYPYYFSFKLLYAIITLLFILNFGYNNKILVSLGSNLINLNIILISIITSSYSFTLYKNNGFLQLISLSTRPFELYILLKNIIYWSLLQIPLCFLGYLNYYIFTIEVSNITMIIYFIITLIFALVNSITVLLVSQLKQSNIYVLILNLLFNIPIIIYMFSLSEEIPSSYFSSFLGLYLTILFLLIPFLSSSIFHNILRE